MKKGRTLQYIMPCGRVIFVQERTPKDISQRKRVSQTLLSASKELNMFYPLRNSGDVKTRWCSDTYNKFSTLLIKKLVDHLMESDRIKTRNGNMWMITQVASHHKKHLNWNTNGAVFSTKIAGLPGKYRIILSRRRSKELTERLNRGQKFHVNTE